MTDPPKINYRKGVRAMTQSQEFVQVKIPAQVVIWIIVLVLALNGVLL